MESRRRPSGRARAVVALVMGSVLGWTALAAAQSPDGAFVNFESGHTRPLALSPDGSKLFAVNTPDNRLAIYDVTAGGLTLAAEVPVGLEPVAVAARSNTEVWVVNHLSDSISIVQVNPTTPSLSRVTRTLLTCDEPRDIVFAGPGGNRAFVTTARRGQNCPVAANLTTAGIGRAVVQVWDATNLGTTLAGTPIASITLFTDTPRALARTPDGTRVYAAGFHTGNRTTTIFEATVTSNGGLPPNPPGSTPGRPNVGLIVKFNGTNWVDEINRNWNARVPFSLPDRDVFIIDASATTPALVPAPNNVQGVGTVIFNMAVRPGANRLYVSNTDARNHVRFEPRINDMWGVQGHIAESRITIVNGTTPTPRHLNPHIDYTCVPPVCISPQSERDNSLAFPTDMVFSSDGSRLYVAGLGSGKVGIFDAAALEAGTITPLTKTLVQVGQGPSGVVLDEAHDRLYVMNRISHDISIVLSAS
jgi:DNA-binding beta-propeller fold protein YncE